MAICPRCGVTNSDHANSCDVCRAPMGIVLPPGRTARNAPPSLGRRVPGPNAYAAVPGRKNVGAAILLALFLGPLGMFYSTIVGALVMLLLSVVLGFRTEGVALLFTWPIGVFWAAIAAQLSKQKIA